MRICFKCILLLALLMGTSVFAETRTGNVGGSSAHVNVQFNNVVDEQYTLRASPSGGWHFTEDFSFPGGNGWFRTETYGITSEINIGTNTVFVDAASIFSATIAGKMFTSGEESGDLIAWSVTGKYSGADAVPGLVPATALQPRGVGREFRYTINGATAPDAFWKAAFSGGTTTQWSRKGATYQFPCDDAGILQLTAARNTDGALSATATITVVEVGRLSGGGVSSTTDSPGETETLYLAKGGSAVTLTAAKNPTAATAWPNGFPKWSQSKDGGAFSTIGTAGQTTYSFNPSEAGIYVVKAECGDGYIKAMKVTVVEVGRLSGGGVSSTTDSPGETETLYLGKGGPAVTLTTEKIPAAAKTWPNDFPKWSQSKDGGAFSTVGTDGQSTYSFSPSDIGSYVIKVRCGDSYNKAIKIVVIEFSFITPSGDPVTNPSGNNEFVYSTAANGVLTLNLSVQITPAAIAEKIKTMCAFSVSSIGTDNGTWDSANSQGKPVSNSGKLEAKVTFTGLPKDNSSFGKKTAQLLLNGIAVKTQDYEVFFPRDASNHPTCSSCPGCPNWFFYWRQAYPYSNMKYVNDNTILGRVPAMTSWSYSIAKDKTHIEIGSQNPVSGKAYGIGKLMSGIDMFINTIIHENKHVDQINRADTLLPTNKNDSFRYGWAWNVSAHNHWTKGPDGEWGIANVDDDGNGTIDDAAPLPQFEPGHGDDVDLSDSLWSNKPAIWSWISTAPYTGIDSPIEREAIKAADDAMNENDYARSDWGSPGKNHKTLNKWND